MRRPTVLWRITFVSGGFMTVSYSQTQFAAHRYKSTVKGVGMVTCQVRLVSEDVLLETREMDTLPSLGDEIVIEGEVYYTAAPPSEVINGEAIVYVSKVA